MNCVGGWSSIGSLRLCRSCLSEDLARFVHGVLDKKSDHRVCLGVGVGLVDDHTDVIGRDDII